MHAKHNMWLLPSFKIHSALPDINSDGIRKRIQVSWHEYVVDYLKEL